MSATLLWRDNLLTCKRLIAAHINEGDLIRSLRKYELLQSGQAAEKVRTIARLIDFVLAGVIVGSVVIGFILFRYFMRGIHRGVQALMLNIRRFKAGEALVPAIGGTDEIAILDERFHEMADDVATAHRMKQSFIDTIASELRTPISSSRELAMQLASGSLGALSESATTRAKKAEASLQQLLRLINDLLALESRGIRHMEIQSRMCSLNDAVQSSIDAVSVFAERNGVQL